MMDGGYDDKLRQLSFAAITTAWAGMDDSARHDVIDLLSTADDSLALDYLVQSPTIDPAVADQIRSALASSVA